MGTFVLLLDVLRVLDVLNEAVLEDIVHDELTSEAAGATTELWPLSWPH